MTNCQSKSREHEERLLIDGRLTTAKYVATFANINPATEKVMGMVADASAEDMDPRNCCRAEGPQGFPSAAA